MKDIQVNVLTRDLKEKQNALRANGFVPAVIYSHGKTEHCKVLEKDVSYIFSHGITESTMLQIKKEDSEKNFAAYIKDYQKHPVSAKILHIDFFRITFGEKIKTHIPIHFVGESVGVKNAGGVFEVFIRELEIETYPKFLQENLEVDISNLDIGDAIHIHDIELPKETKIIISGNQNPQVCHISPPIKAEQTEPTETATTEESKKENSE